MRTTVTIDADTEYLLREEAIRTGDSFKEVLNQSIRRALSQPSPERLKVEPLFTAPFPQGLTAVSMNRFADAWDDEEALRELSR